MRPSKPLRQTPTFAELQEFLSGVALRWGTAEDLLPGQAASPKKIMRELP
jgi:hypothetical protein